MGSKDVVESHPRHALVAWSSRSWVDVVEANEPEDVRLPCRGLVSSATKLASWNCLHAMVAQPSYHGRTCHVSPCVGRSCPFASFETIVFIGSAFADRAQHQHNRTKRIILLSTDGHRNKDHVGDV